MTICKYWKEVEGEGGLEHEYCKLEKCACSCCGVQEQCNVEREVRGNNGKNN